MILCCFLIYLVIVSCKFFDLQAVAICIDFMRIPTTHNFGEESVRNAKLLVIGKKIITEI